MIGPPRLPSRDRKIDNWIVTPIISGPTHRGNVKEKMLKKRKGGGRERGEGGERERRRGRERVGDGGGWVE